MAIVCKDLPNSDLGLESPENGSDWVVNNFELEFRVELDREEVLASTLGAGVRAESRVEPTAVGFTRSLEEVNTRGARFGTATEAARRVPTILRSFGSFAFAAALFEGPASAAF